MAQDLTPPAAAPDFLQTHGWGGASIEPIAGDASFRRYFKVQAGERCGILMDAPPPHEDATPFVYVARWLLERGFAAPAIHAVDLTRGLVLMEHLGDDRMREAVDADPSRAPGLYAGAVDVLTTLHRKSHGPFAAYDKAVLHREVDLLTEWYCPAVGLEVDQAAYHAAWSAVFDLAIPARPVTVLRDYHSENLMILSNGRVGLLDFQDALVGHPAYDLVSLLQDARRDVEPEIERTMLARYRDATGANAAFDDAYHVLGAQRNAKIIGIFARLWKRDGKLRYPALCPRVWRYLERDLANPALLPVAAWFDANIPGDRRGDPLLLSAR